MGRVGISMDSPATTLWDRSNSRRLVDVSGEHLGAENDGPGEPFIGQSSAGSGPVPMSGRLGVLEGLAMVHLERDQPTGGPPFSVSPPRSDVPLASVGRLALDDDTQAICAYSLARTESCRDVSGRWSESTLGKSWTLRRLAATTTF